MKIYKHIIDGCVNAAFVDKIGNSEYIVNDYYNIGPSNYPSTETPMAISRFMYFMNVFDSYNLDRLRERTIDVRYQLRRTGNAKSYYLRGTSHPERIKIVPGLMLEMGTNKVLMAVMIPIDIKANVIIHSTFRNIQIWINEDVALVKHEKYKALKRNILRTKRLAGTVKSLNRLIYIKSDKEMSKLMKPLSYKFDTISSQEYKFNHLINIAMNHEEQDEINHLIRETWSMSEL